MLDAIRFEMLRLRRMVIPWVLMAFPLLLVLVPLVVSGGWSDHEPILALSMSAISQAVLFGWFVGQVVANARSDGYLITRGVGRVPALLGRLAVLGGAAVVVVGAATAAYAVRGQISPRTTVQVTYESSVEHGLELAAESHEHIALAQRIAERHPSDRYRPPHYVWILAPWLRAKELALFLLAFLIGLSAETIAGPRRTAAKVGPRGWLSLLPMLSVMALSFNGGQDDVFVHLHFRALLVAGLAFLATNVVTSLLVWQRADVR